jgi:hypothetical protein
MATAIETRQAEYDRFVKNFKKGKPFAKSVPNFEWYIKWRERVEGYEREVLRKRLLA